MILDKTVIIKWNSKNKIWYENKGYIYTKIRNEFEVKVEDLTNGSNVRVNVQCDNCGKISNVRWIDYQKCIKENEKYYCHECAQSPILFSQWFIDNNNEHLLKLWNCDLNKCSPYETPYSSSKKYYYKYSNKMNGSIKKSVKDLKYSNYQIISYKRYKGENAIKEYLKNNNIEYNFQKTYKNLVGIGKYPLSYDFYLPTYNLLIEYDGEFHYEPINLGKKDSIKSAQIRFKKQKAHDKLKDEYAKNNNIKLLRIPYWDYDNIENILNKNLFKYNII